MADDSTTKFRVDISELKKAFRDAQRQIQMVNSEFKASTASMGKWSDNADGLSAKLKQLNGTLEAEETKLKTLEKQYELVSKAQGADSKGAQELLIKINNQKAAIDKIKSSIGYYSEKLTDVRTESSRTADATEKLTQSIEKQQSDLDELKRKYTNLVLEQGESSAEAKKCAAQIKQLSGDLGQNKAALESASDAAESLDKSLDEAKDGADRAGGGFTVLKGALSDLIADGIKAGISAMKEFATESDTAYKNFQAQTGASADEMRAFKKEMNDLYKNNYGESMQDLADKMAYIKQVTGETDPSNIRELTENAIALEDTFGSDFNETVRGVQNLMQHFGITAEEAFDLFAKGSQEGLDYTDELGDNIAEYGGNFKQAGYSAEEYFQLLKNGTAGGAYNLDKVNDSINEVKNRLGDGTIEKSIKSFSKNTQTAFKAWKSGKGTMKDVIDSIVKDISSCKSEQDALTMAATAFGTMGEDANLNVVKSLTTTGNAFRDVKGKMEEVKNVKYDTIESNLETIKRGLITNIVQPLAGPVLSGLVKFGGWFKANTGTILSSLAAIGTALLVLNITTIATKAAAALGTMTTAIQLMGLAIAANPVGLLVSALSAVTVGVVAYRAAAHKARIASDENVVATKKLVEQQKELTDVLKESESARKEETSSATEQNTQADIYFSRLSKLIGVEKKSSAQKALIADYVAKLNELMPDLNLKYDQEKDKLNKSTEAIRDNIKAQKDLLLAKAAQKNLESMASDIAKVETQQTELQKQRVDNELAYNEAQKKTAEARKKWEETGQNAYSQEFKNYQKAAEAEEAKKKAYDQTTSAIESNKQKLKELNAAYETTEKYAEEKINTGTIESGLASITEKMRKKGKEVPKAVADGIKSGQYAIPSTVKGMENQIKFDSLITKANLTGTKIPKNLANGVASGKTSAQNAVKALQDVAKFDNSKIVADAKASGVKIPESLRKGIASGKVSVEEASKKVAEASVKAQRAGSKGSKKNGQNASKDYADGVRSKTADASKSGKAVGKSAATGAQSGSKGMKSAGATGAENFAGSIRSKTPLAVATATNLSRNASEGLNTYNASASTSGQNFAQGFINGIGSLVVSAANKARELARTALTSLQKAQKEGSPSKLTTQSGKYFGEGYKNGIATLAKPVAKEAASMAESAYQALRKAQQEGSPSKLTYQSGVNFMAGYIHGMESMGGSLQKTVKKLVGGAVKNAMELSNFDFADSSSAASNKFSDKLGDNITYIGNKLSYQNDKKISGLESQLTKYQNSLDKAQTSYDKAKSAYDKAQTNYKKYQKNLAKYEKKLKQAKSDTSKSNYKDQIAEAKKEIASAKKKSAASKKEMDAAKKQITSYKKLVSEQTKFNKAYQDASSQMLSELNDALGDYQSKAQELIDNTINGISEKYQAKYDALIEKQDSLIDKLKSAGDLFDISDAGIMTVNDLKAQTKSIKDYTEKLQKIKGKVSADLFDQIASYDMDQGNAFMDRLLALSDADLKAYSKAYDEKMKAAEDAGKKIYKKDLDKVASDYSKEVDAAFKKLPGQLETIGVMSMNGFVKGLTKNTDYLSKSVKTLINGMIGTFRKDLLIHSPSKVTEELGSFTGLGFGNGLLKSVKTVQENVKKLIDSTVTSLDGIKVPTGDIRGKVGSARQNQTQGAPQTIVNNYNLTQNNTSPKSLSALETYRARRQQVNMVKAMTQPV